MPSKVERTTTTEEKDLPETEIPVDEESNIPTSQTDDTSKSRSIKDSLVAKIGVYSVTFLVVVLVIWGIGSLIVEGSSASPERTLEPTSTAVSLPANVETPEFSTESKAGGLYRMPEMQVTSNPMPVASRDEVTMYTVEAGDTIFGIADKFGLTPETVLWSNRYILGDTPDGLSIGVEINILPVNGVYHMWSEGEGLNGVASFYGVSPDDIVNYPGNELDPDVVGDYANPNIEPGKMLVVPGGERPSVAWIVPRDNPASGNSYLGPGACGGIIYGNVGTGTFTYPTTATWLSGYEYNPPVHNGLDFDGDFGSPIYAADSGVVVYSGWSDRGYGNLIVIDHESGWQTFYAHMIDGSMVPCGSNVQKGQLIASMGSTGNSSGPHLHFELRLEGHPVNPWQFLN